MNIKKLTLNSPDYPEPLRNIPKPPAVLYMSGAPLNKLLSRPAVAIVGSRRISPYGQQVTRQFARELAKQGVVIVSGLAYGVDAMAHRAALESGGFCIGVLPSPLDNILPAANRRLAKEILQTGGALVSEYAPGDIPFKQNFVARNRLMSGLAKAVLVTEATDKSGTKHTVGYAGDQNREVMAVPGSIYNQSSAGTNNYIKAQKAAPVTTTEDILNILEFKPHKTKIRLVKGSNAHEQAILDLMLRGITDGAELLEGSRLSVSHFNQSLTMLEIAHKIRPLGANHWSIY